MNSNAPEMIGALEQANLNIYCPDGSGEIPKGAQFSHREIHTRNMLSLLAAMTPFSDYNQSPRNMYQCQMLKQSMGTPCHDMAFRPDTKMYR